MASVEMESTGYIYRKCQHCSGNIPRYVGVGKARKETRRDARFCSKRCADMARRSAKPAKGEMTASDLSEMPVD
jgi:ribosomal protein L24E